MRSKGERAFFKIITSMRYWVNHAVTLPSICMAAFMFLSNGLAYDTLSTLGTDAYFQASGSRLP